MNEESKKFIRLAKEILDQENVTQNSVNNAINYIRQAIEQIKTEKSEVTSIELNDIIIKKSGRTKQITPTIIPATAKDKTLTYESEELGYRNHKIKIEVLGEKREVAREPKIAIYRFEIDEEKNNNLDLTELKAIVAELKVLINE